MGKGRGKPRLPVGRGDDLEAMPFKEQLRRDAHQLLIDFARIGLGIACITKEYAMEDLKEEGLFEIALDPPLPPRAMGLITLDNVPLSPAAERFIQIVTQQME